MRVCLQLLAWVADDPELKALLGLFRGERQCDQCWCPKDDLSNTCKTHQMRTSQQQQLIQGKIAKYCQERERNKALELSKRHSTRPVPCALNGFADRDTASTDMHR
jgi:hypothetical protein